MPSFAICKLLSVISYYADSGRGASTSNSRPSSQIDHDVIRKSTIATSDEGEGSNSPKQIKGRN